MTTLFTDVILTRSLLMFLILGSIAGLCTGTALLLRPQWLLHVSKHANRWVSTRQLSRPLMQLFSLDRWLYRYNRISGAIIMAGSFYIVYYITSLFEQKTALSHIFTTNLIAPALMSGLIDAVVLASITGAVFALVVSLFLLFRPSMLSGFERHANQITSLRQALKPLEVQHGSVDQFIFNNMRLIGVLIIAGSTYTLVVLLGNWKVI